ncbi:MAG: InlB B-repeat-containing protein [Bacilli bacterium]
MLKIKNMLVKKKYIGLGVSEVGPINRSKPVNTGSGPDIVQFPSGETLLSYHMWPSFQIKIGDNYAKFDNESISNGNIEEVRCYIDGTYKQGDTYNQYLHKKLNRNTYCAAINIADFGTTNKGGYDFGGLYVDNSHRVLATLTYIDSKGSHLKISQYYLNHSIDSYSDGLSQKNDDALFIGSDSSAQETVRSFHDNDYLYFVVDRLDTSISSADSNGLRIHSDALMYNDKKYNYLWISFNNQKITRTNVGSEGNLEKIENLVSAKYIYSDNGYKVIVKIPKIDKNKNFYFIDNNTKKIEVFAAITKGDKYDILEGAKESDIRTWMNVYLKAPKEKVKIPSSPTDKIYTGNIQNHGIIVPENATIITTSTIQAKDVGEYEVVLKLNDTNKYVWEDGTSENKKIKWIIKQATPQITLTAKTTEYSGSPISANIANVTPVGGKVSYVYYIDSNCSTKTTLENGGAKSIGGAPINTGTYYVKATATASLNTKQISSGCIKHVINKKVLPIPVKIGDRLYSGNVQSSGIVCPTGSIAGGEVSGVSVKTYTQTCTLSSNKNYIWSDGTTNVIKIDWKILSKEGTYKVTFNDGNNELYSGYVSSGKTISRPSINPEKVNYRFDNWYEDTSLTKIYDFSTPIKSNKIIYAKFIEQKKIILDINGGVDNGFKNYLYDKGATLNRYDIEKQLNEFIIPPDNQKIDYITIDGIKWEKNTYILNNNITIKIIWKDKGITYEILNGNNQSYIIDSNSNFIIKSSGNLEKLINITMDGIIIEESNYDVTSGSTILTLKPSYLNQLPLGNHEIEFVYSDGSANTKITIVESDKYDNSYKDIVKNNNFKYIIILLSALFLVGIVIYIKRKKRV